MAENIRKKYLYSVLFTNAKYNLCSFLMKLRLKFFSTKNYRHIKFLNKALFYISINFLYE